MDGSREPEGRNPVVLWDQRLPFPIALAQFLSTAVKLTVVERREDRIVLRGEWRRTPGACLIPSNGVPISLDKWSAAITWTVDINVLHHVAYHEGVVMFERGVPVGGTLPSATG